MDNVIDMEAARERLAQSASEQPKHQPTLVVPTGRDEGQLRFFVDGRESPSLMLGIGGKVYQLTQNAQIIQICGTGEESDDEQGD